MPDHPSRLPVAPFPWFALTVVTTLLALLASAPAKATPAEDARTVAALDTAYQAAVEQGDAAAMDRILADDFVLVLGRGTTRTKDELLEETRKQRIRYEHQVEEAGTQKVRVRGDTAVVTASLWLKGTNDGQPFERRLWFSDTYVRTAAGWKYFFGQASLPLPAAAK